MRMRMRSPVRVANVRFQNHKSIQEKNRYLHVPKALIRLWAQLSALNIYFLHCASTLRIRTPKGRNIFILFFPHTFLAQALSSRQLTCTCAHSSDRN